MTEKEQDEKMMRKFHELAEKFKKSGIRVVGDDEPAGELHWAVDPEEILLEQEKNSKQPKKTDSQ